MEQPSQNSFSRVIVIVGPTASGKSSLAQEVAVALGGEVISADSMQVYRGMDIGTAKVPPHERRVPHHGIDLVDPDETFSAALFQRYARDLLREKAQEGVPCVLAGGTGLYVRAVLDDLNFAAGEQANNPIREHYQVLHQSLGDEGLWKVLAERDPQSAALIHPHNVRRVIRALEMGEAGESYSQRAERFAVAPSVVPNVQFGLAVEPNLLAQRIDERVEAMVAQGLVDEVASLVNDGFEEALTAKQAIGYKEMLAYLHGQSSLDEALAAIKQATRRLAKRQRTWFRRDQRIHWLDANEGSLDRLTDEVLRQLDE